MDLSSNGGAKAERDGRARECDDGRDCNTAQPITLLGPDGRERRPPAPQSSSSPPPSTATANIAPAPGPKLLSEKCCAAPKDSPHTHLIPSKADTDASRLPMSHGHGRASRLHQHARPPITPADAPDGPAAVSRKDWSLRCLVGSDPDALLDRDEAEAFPDSSRKKACGDSVDFPAAAASSKKGFCISRDVSRQGDLSKLTATGREDSHKESKWSFHDKEAANRSPIGEEKEGFCGDLCRGDDQEWDRLCNRGEPLPTDEKLPAVKFHTRDSEKADRSSSYKTSSKVLGQGQENLEGQDQRHRGNHPKKDGLCERSADSCSSIPVRCEYGDSNSTMFHVVKRVRSDREKPGRGQAAVHQVFKEIVLQPAYQGEPEICGRENGFALSMSTNKSNDGEEEGEAVSLAGVKRTGSRALYSSGAYIGDVHKTKGIENLQSTFENRRKGGTPLGFLVKKKQQKSDLEDDAEENSERMDRHTEITLQDDGVTADSDARVEHNIEKNSEHAIEESDQQQDENCRRKREDEDCAFQITSMPERLLVEQFAGICQQHERTADAADDFQKECTKVGEICMRDFETERKSGCRMLGTVPPGLNENIELTLHLLHEPAGKLNQANKMPSNLGTKKNDSSKELTLSLSMKPPVAECKNWDDILECRKKAAITFEELHKGGVLQGNDQRKANKQGISSTDLSETPCERRNQKRQKLECFSLSLALPDSSAWLASSHSERMLDSPNINKTIHSLGQTDTNSDDFTTSLSFTHSHPFVHNRSCSLTCSSFDQEFSCGSHQISQINEIPHGSWQAPFKRDRVSNGSCGLNGPFQERMRFQQEFSCYQKPLQNEDSQGYQSFSSYCMDNKGLLNSYEEVGNNKVSNGYHQISQKLGTVQITDDRSVKGGQIGKSVLALAEHNRLRQERRLLLPQSTGSQQTKIHHRMIPDTTRDAPITEGAYSSKNEDVAGRKSLGCEKIGLLEIVTEPIVAMARKLQELSDSFLEGLKDSVKNMLGSLERKGEAINLQTIIQTRTDLMEEALLLAHPIQLKILLALKTGMQDFVHSDCQNLSHKALIEIFRGTRCRNIFCQFSLPVDSCECKICSQKNGFCNACMCVECLKFDIEAETCHWIGCDYCMHWCHTDCGIEKSYIVPGSSIKGTSGTSGMQFHCIGCGHNSELYGFVKEVFTNFSDQWSAEALAKELDCVRRLFCPSKDTKGKQLYQKAKETLQKLENKVGVCEIKRSVMQLFTEGDIELQGPSHSIVEPVNSQAVPGHVADVLWDASLKSNSKTGNESIDLDRPSTTRLQAYGCEFEEKKYDGVEIDYERSKKQTEIEELERAARIKLAEAKMFQLKADEAWQEAEGLQKIVLAKSKKTDKDFSCKVIKLQMNEAEDRKRKQLEEIHVLERKHRECQGMKMRMEVDIKDLLKKMKVGKQQLMNSVKCTA